MARSLKCAYTWPWCQNIYLLFSFITFYNAASQSNIHILKHLQRVCHYNNSPAHHLIPSSSNVFKNKLIYYLPFFQKSWYELYIHQFLSILSENKNKKWCFRRKKKMMFSCKNEEKKSHLLLFIVRNTIFYWIKTNTSPTILVQIE